MASDHDISNFDAIARELAQPLLRYLERYVGNPALAEDLRQETLIRMTRGLAGFSGRSSLKTWAFAIASRVAADYFRPAERRLPIVELEEAGEIAAADEDSGERLIADEMNRCVREVIDSLPDPYRAALILHDLEDLTAEQVAEICDCSLATAKIRIHRARARLREALGRRCAFYRDAEGVFRCDRAG